MNILCKGNKFTLAGKFTPGTNLLLDFPPTSELVTEFIHKVGQSNRDSNRVEVPFSHVAPPDSALWSEETTSELRVPIGRTGATKFQYLAIGKGTRQHALLAGKTGSGKSTLFHVMITNLALWCSPEQVEFYLIDFKKGVEFKCYAEKRLPHVRVVAIEMRLLRPVGKTLVPTAKGKKVLSTGAGDLMARQFELVLADQPRPLGRMPGALMAAGRYRLHRLVHVPCGQGLGNSGPAGTARHSAGHRRARSEAGFFWPGA